MCLFVNMHQFFQALTYFTSFINGKELSVNDRVLPKREPEFDSAIIDSLWYQIIIDACAFLDEWNTILGVKTEKEYKEKVLSVKKTAASATRAISRWKDLKKFRNEVIAHNFRNKAGSFTIPNMADYNCPQTYIELKYLVSYYSRIINVLTENFPEFTQEILEEFPEKISSSKNLSGPTELDIKELEATLNEIDQNLF